MKLTHLTSPRNILTNFKYEAHAMTGNGSYVNLLIKTRENTRLNFAFFIISGETTTDGQDELSKTPTNKNSSNDSITESSDKTETFQQRKEEAKSRRRKKKKTNSSVVATAFQVKNFVQSFVLPIFGGFF